MIIIPIDALKIPFLNSSNTSHISLHNDFAKHFSIKSSQYRETSQEKCVTKQPFALSAAFSLRTQLLTSAHSYQIFYPSPCVIASHHHRRKLYTNTGFQLNAKEKEQKDATCWGMKRDHVKPVVPRDALQRRKERSMHFVIQASRRRTALGTQCAIAITRHKRKNGATKGRTGGRELTVEGQSGMGGAAWTM